MAKKMHKISFYQFHCVDGRATTAIDTDDTTAWEHETPAKGPRDSLILWDWDFRCRGARLPTDPEKVIGWLREQGPLARAELTRLADKVLTAVHPSDWPLLYDVAHPPRGVRMQFFCHAIRPMTLRRLARKLREVGERWDDLLSLLQTTRAASA